jgi:hypothetical protein
MAGQNKQIARRSVETDRELHVRDLDRAAVQGSSTGSPASRAETDAYATARSVGRENT